MNIFDATPVIKPSLFASIAGEVTEFEKPVIGTRAPPPPNLAILSNTPIPVNKLDKKIKNTLDLKDALYSMSAFDSIAIEYLQDGRVYKTRTKLTKM